MEVGPALLPLPKLQVHVWHTDFERPISSVHDILDPEERARAARFKVDAARRQFIVSHAFLRLALERYLGIPARDIGFEWLPTGNRNWIWLRT